MRAIIKGSLITIYLLGFVIVAAILKLFRRHEAKQRFAMFSAKVILKIVGMTYSVEGELTEKRPLLLVTNHTSYMDIFILGAELPVVFTPKSEIASWPGIGTICRLLDSVFIDRRSSKTPQNRQAMRKALEKGHVVCLFPEGTTNDGKRVLPFHSSLLSVAESQEGEEPLTVQPAAIRYTHVHNLPVDSALLPKIAWYGDMELVSHVAELLRLGPIHAKLTYLDPVPQSSLSHRKEIASYCEEKINNCFASQLPPVK